MRPEASAATAICSTGCAPLAEASKVLLPSFLEAQEVARGQFLHSLPAASFTEFSVRTESSTRRPASCTPPLRPSKTGDLPKRRVANARVSRALDQVTFSDAALALHGEKRDDINANVLYYSQRKCCGRRNDAGLIPSRALSDLSPYSATNALRRIN